MDRLHRTRLLLGDAAVEKLRSATVMVVGCGAVGSFAIECLARAGVGNIVIVDFDTVAQSNINRQLFALESSLGMPKVDVAAARIHDINPNTCVHPINAFWDDKIDIDIIPDVVIDAIDNVSSKIALYKWCASRNIVFISSMGAARKTKPDCVRVSKISDTTVCPLAAKIRSEIRGMNLPDFDVVFSTERAAPQITPGKVFGSIVTVTGTFGIYMANWAIDKIIGPNTTIITRKEK